MSLDYSTYSKTKCTDMRAVRAAAQLVLARHEGLSLRSDDEDDDENNELFIEGLGPIDVTAHGFGVQLSISSASGVRETFVELGELADEICTELGELVSDDEAGELLAIEEEREPKSPQSVGRIHVDRVIVVLRDREGVELSRASASRAQFAGQRDQHGMLLPELRAPDVPTILGEEGRLAYRGKTLECLVHDSDGVPLVHLIYDLDGYGRIKGVSQEKP